MRSVRVFSKVGAKVRIGNPGNPFIGVALLALAICAGAARAAPVEAVARLASGTEIVSERYLAPTPAASGVLALWLTGQFGHIEEEHKAAADMAAHGVETWVTDFLAPYFLPLLPSSWARIPDQDLAEWLQDVRQRNPGRRIVLVSTGRVASIALRAVRSWQNRYGGAPTGDSGVPKPVAGALLMFPLLYQELAPGQEPEYDPVVNQSELDLVILQPKASAGYWWRERLKGFLEAAGSRVSMTVLPGLRDGFYRRGDITSQEVAAGERLGQIVLDGLKPLIGKE